MTYGKAPDQSLPDHPRNIDALGYKDAFHYTTVWKGKKVQKNISALAYKSGTGNAVALSFSTVDTSSHWDLVPNDDSHHKWYFNTNLSDDERKMKGFKLIIGKKKEAAEQLLLSRVDPRTCGPEGQGSREWFVDRMFSGTSSTVHAVFKKCIPFLAEEEDDDTMSALKVVLSFTGKMDILEKIVADRQQQQEREQQQQNGNGNGNMIQGDGGDNEDQDNRDKEEAQEWILKLSASKDLDEQFKKSIEDATITSATVEWILALTADTSFKEMSVGAAKKKIDKWLAGDGEAGEAKRRPYKNMQKTSLKRILQEKGIAFKDTDNKAALIKNIVDPPAQPIVTPQDNEVEPLAELLHQSFLRPLNDKAERTAAATGHKNEVPFIRAFCEKCMDEQETEDNIDSSNNSEFRKFKDISIYRPGLVKKKGSKFAKGSADGILAAKVRFVGIVVVVMLFS